LLIITLVIRRQSINVLKKTKQAMKQKNYQIVTAEMKMKIMSKKKMMKQTTVMMKIMMKMTTTTTTEMMFLEVVF